MHHVEAACVQDALGECKYTLQLYKDTKAAFVAKTRAFFKVKFPNVGSPEVRKAVNAAWTQSAERADILAGMPEAEMKRRRFI